MVIGCLENFLAAFEKKVSSEKSGFSLFLPGNPNPILRLGFIKISFFQLFLTNIVFEVSYDFDFFTDVKNKVRRTC